ncbi:MAG: polyprenyl synthetase family protein [Candidatus Gastranaerophilaceae bacterium]
MSFNEKYSNIKSLVRNELDMIEKNMVSGINVREPLNTFIREFLMLPSKRIRSVLPLLYLKADNQSVTSEQIQILTAIELIHNASLIHDDVIDNSDMRRAHKTLSNEFDNKLAVISGDYILSVVMQILTNLRSVELISKFSKTIEKMCVGEINQNFNRYKFGTIEDYIEKTKNKTAYLFEISFMAVLMFARKKYDCETLSKFALDTGIAFQIRDDLLNLTDDDTSKPKNNDIEDGIYNAPVIYSGQTEDLTQGIEKTRVLLNNYIKSARANLTDLPDNEYKTALYNILELLNND